MNATLTYVHDPMCSWCYAFAPTLAALLPRLPAALDVRRLLGGLAPDTSEPMPARMCMHLQGVWQRIESTVPGTTFNFEFWTRCAPRRSTYPACRAVIAARDLEADAEGAMVGAIQHAYYREARNPSDSDTLVALARQIGLDGADFAARLVSPSVDATLRREIAQARALPIAGFPALVLTTAQGHCPLPIDYRDAGAMADTAVALLGRMGA